MDPNNSLVTPFFEVKAVKDEAASRTAGRPIFRNVEFVQVRIAGDRHYAPRFPAHTMWKRENGEVITYAQRWAEQYARFKADQEQIADGTPLSELPFLDEAQRATLKALRIYSAEALAALDGKPLKSLGMEGNKLKQKAKAYLETARDTALSTRQAEEISTLRAELDALRAQMLKGAALEPEPEDEGAIEGSGLDALTDDDLKALIAERTGSRPRGNPSRATLLSMAAELGSERAA